MSADGVVIEQRLQDMPRILFFTIDEAFVVGLPLLVGMLAMSVITGALCSVVAWKLWSLVKSDGGVERVQAYLYWYVPRGLSLYRSFPDSAVATWKG